MEHFRLLSSLLVLILVAAPFVRAASPVALVAGTAVEATITRGTVSLFSWTPDATTPWVSLFAVPFDPLVVAQLVGFTQYYGNSSSTGPLKYTGNGEDNARVYLRASWWSTSKPIYFALQLGSSTSYDIQTYTSVRMAVTIFAGPVAVPATSLPILRSLSALCTTTSSDSSAAKVQVMLQSMQKTSVTSSSPWLYTAYILNLSQEPTLANMNSMFSVAKVESTGTQLLGPSGFTEDSFSVTGTPSVVPDQWTIIAVVAQNITSGAKVLYAPVTDYYCSNTKNFNLCPNIVALLALGGTMLVIAIAVPIVLCCCCIGCAIGIFCYIRKRNAKSHQPVPTYVN